jgi:putative hemolysin
MNFWQFAVVGVLILINGFFAMSELAMVSARRGRLQAMADRGSSGARRALKLMEDPTALLSTVQIGITLVGVFAGAYSGATLSRPLAETLGRIDWLATYADQLAIALVVIIVTYLSLIIGEIVPKRIALNHAEAIAAFVATPMTVIARVGAPIVWFLRLSTNAVLAVTGMRRGPPESTVTEEEIKTLIAEGTQSGVFKPAEQEMIEGVIRIADRSIRTIMVPRPDVIWIDVEDPPETTLREILGSGHSRFPASRREVDEVVGVVHVKDLLEQLAATGRIDVSAALEEPLFVDEHMPILRLLDRFKSSAVHMAIVLDEHGAFEGIVTPTDILIAIAGDLPEAEGESEPDMVQRADGSWLLNGRMPIDDAERTLALQGMNEGEEFQTLAGFVLHQMGHIPQAGETFSWRGWRFEVVDLDGRRIDKVMAEKLPEET